MEERKKQRGKSMEEGIEQLEKHEGEKQRGKAYRKEKSRGGKAWSKR